MVEDVGGAVSADVLQEERRRKLFLADGRGVRSEADATAYVNERGFVHLFSPGGLPWPNVSDAELRARGSLETFSLEVWQWKNTLPAAKRCAYGHYLRNRGVFISWQFFPAFRKLWGLHESVDLVLESGLLTPVERHVLQVVAVRGPIRSRELRREVQALSGASKRQYQTALRVLQERFLITVAGGSVAGFSMHDWDLVERHVPPEAMTLSLSEDEARAQLVCQAVANAPFCTAREIGLLFGWGRKQAAAVLGELTESGVISAGSVEEQRDLGYRLVG
ncbi:MAG: winged helix DNA-binding domain-containing protein [Chloroflexi bacterium]|nr:winged helix DNA-binding domain-containing protein [Chloroflexota bacterium]